MTLTKITARIDQDLWDGFSEQMDELFIKKGAFLDFVIRTELPHLERDLAGVTLSSKAKRFVANKLGARRPATVSIEIRKETSEALNEIAKRHNIVRDAFVNRLIIFLRGSDKLLRLIGAPQSIDASSFSNLESLPTAPLRSMKCLYDDPLYYLRSFLRQSDRGGVYEVDLGLDHAWAACVIDDESVPGTRKHKERVSLSANDF